ncbi:zinc finger protein 644a isoform X2 [Triplophysa rosa]|uniref:zinc finger protein 644a isoform X2 n=1 Tax=Triplophysa rosa TaxID=992332 RepID=UPI00254605B1|nr:zinc finger protein 644a isoform X2 [Triplophysa rosa]
MSGLSKSSKLEENDTLMSNISQDLLNSGVFSPKGTLLEPSVQCPQETMELLCDQGDLLTSVGFMDSICSDGPPKAAYVNGSTSPHISDEVLLDISKNVPGFLPKSLNAQNSVTANVHFEGHDPLRKEGEITIRQTLTAEDVENRGIWGFDTESPESSLDNYNDANDLSWNPQKEFMKFLWDDENALEMEEKLSPVPSPINHKINVPSPLVHRKRKRKAEIVLKVDPSMDLYPNLDFDSKIDHQGEGSQAECSPVKKIRSPRKPSKPRSPIVKTNKYLNGGAEAVKHLFPKPAKKPVSKTQKLGLIIENLPTDPGAKEQPAPFPRKNSFKEKPQEHRQITFNTDTPSLKPFICKECGQCFHDRGSLLHHIDVHKAKHPKTKKERNEFHEMKDEGKNATLQCPQCTFGTNCPNTFVQHAKTHEKDKRYYSCNKCDFVEMNEFQMRNHLLHKHSERDADLTVWKSDGFQARKVNKANKNAAAPSSISNSFKRKTKNILGNHVDTSCLQKFNEDQKAFHSLDSSNEVLTTRAQLPARSPKLSVKFQTSDKKKSRLTNGKCSRLQKDKKLRKAQTNSKQIQRLDKSVHTVLSRKKHQSASECSSFQNLDGINETGFLDRGKCHYNDSLECETATSETERTSPSSNCLKKYFSSKEGITKSTSKSDGNVSCSESIGNCDSYKGSPPNSIHLKKQTLKSPSKRKMSTPFHNMQGQDILLDFPKCRQNLKKQETSKDEEYSNNDDLIRDSDHTVGSCLSEEWEDKHDQCALKSPAKGDQSSSRMFSVKEEHKDEEVYNAGSESISAVKRESGSDLETDLKACPYCPAVFESEVDTSKTGQQTEMPTDCQQTELVCPLCREWFDNRTGLSNHVRGHLKRLGKPTSTASKSPVVILKELMRDKKQFQLKLQVLERKYRGSRIYQPVRLNNGLTFSSTVKQHKYIHSRSVEEKKRIVTNKGSPPSDLIGILKKRRAHEETKAKCPSHTARKALSISSGRERGLEIQPFKAVPNSNSADKSEVSRKVCLHCNATFHSGVSLSNHMRAYAHRKKKGLSDGITYDCKQRKQRSRSGSKKKTFPLLHAPEEIYRLKCRFCDLVFQGPLSVQEDWIKHLQRHIMNTAVPRTGAGMVEVTTYPTNSCSNSEPQAQPSVMQTSSLDQEL